MSPLIVVAELFVIAVLGVGIAQSLSQLHDDIQELRDRMK